MSDISTPTVSSTSTPTGMTTRTKVIIAVSVLFILIVVGIAAGLGIYFSTGETSDDQGTQENQEDEESEKSTNIYDKSDINKILTGDSDVAPTGPYANFTSGIGNSGNYANIDNGRLTRLSGDRNGVYYASSLTDIKNVINSNSNIPGSNKTLFNIISSRTSNTVDITSLTPFCSALAEATDNNSFYKIEGGFITIFLNFKIPYRLIKFAGDTQRYLVIDFGSLLSRIIYAYNSAKIVGGSNNGVFADPGLTVFVTEITYGNASFLKSNTVNNDIVKCSIEIKGVAK